MSKHTRGPWELSKPYFGERHIYVSSGHTVGGNECISDRQHICVLPYESKRGAIAYHDMFNANARLIAAAPDLLEALEDLIGLAEAAMRESGEYQIESELQEARAAIAKATGEPK